MRKCVGCGSILQTNDPSLVGYVQREDQIYCQRCFKLIHYGSFKRSQEVLSQDEILAKIQKSSDVIALLIDVWQLEFTLDLPLIKALEGKEVIVILTKVDTLPFNTSFERLLTYIKAKLKDLQKLKIQEVFLKTKGHFKELFLDYLRAKGIKRVILCGAVSVGKSTLLNELKGDDILTTSVFGGTTLDLNTIEVDDVEFIDTPGLIDPKSALVAVSDEFLKHLSIKDEVKPQVYQLYSDQSYFLDGLLRLDLKTQKKASLIFYISPRLNIHRTKSANAHEYYSRHLSEFNYRGDLIRHHLDLKDKCELLIDGVGVIALHHLKEAELYLSKNIAYTIRKAVL